VDGEGVKEVLPCPREPAAGRAAPTGAAAAAASDSVRVAPGRRQARGDGEEGKGKEEETRRGQGVRSGGGSLHFIGGRDVDDDVVG